MFANVNGINLFYLDRGQGAPLLLIHGNGCTADVWEGVIPQLSNNFRVIAHDRRSFGRSKAPQIPLTGYFEGHADDAAALLKGLAPVPATVVGWSGGGLAAIHLAIKHPELVRSLVLVEPPLHAKKHPTPAMVKAFLTLNLQRMLGQKRAAARTFFRWATSYTSGGCGFDKLDEQKRNQMLEQAKQTLVELDAGTGEELSDARIRSIRCPVKCLVGSLTPKAIASATSRIAKILPKAEIITIEGAAHLLHIDQPNRFIEALEKS